MTNPLEKAELLEHKLRSRWPTKSQFLKPTIEQVNQIATSRAILASEKKRVSEFTGEEPPF